MFFDYQSLRNPLAPCYLIAEIGVNHGGDMELAKRMISAAKAAGADAVKFQTFTASTLVSPDTPKVHYQKSTTSPHESHYEMIRKLELTKDQHITLKEYCQQTGIEFISTPYDIESVDFLAQIGVSVFKTASADIVDLPLQRSLAKKRKPVIVATGMASLVEIEEVVALYRGEGHEQLVLLHCVSNYPCSDASLNMRAIPVLKSAFDTVIGFSDHSVGPQAAVISVALGAKVIEKHFTLDKNLPGPDHRTSVTPEEFADLVQSVRRAELSLGHPSKSCQEEERQMALVSRKSVFLKKELSIDERLTMEHITMKRPGTGLLARELPKLVGRTAKRHLPCDHMLTWDDLW